jgi:hypothetical protein
LHECARIGVEIITGLVLVVEDDAVHRQHDLSRIRDGEIFHGWQPGSGDDGLRRSITRRTISPSPDVSPDRPSSARRAIGLTAAVAFSTTVVGRFANLAPAIWLYSLNTILISAVAFRQLALTEVESGDGLADRQTSLAILVVSSGLAIAWSLIRQALFAFIQNLGSPLVRRVRQK